MKLITPLFVLVCLIIIYLSVVLRMNVKKSSNNKETFQGATITPNQRWLNELRDQSTNNICTSDKYNAQTKGTVSLWEPDDGGGINSYKNAFALLCPDGARGTANEGCWRPDSVTAGELGIKKGYGRYRAGGVCVSADVKDDRNSIRCSLLRDDACERNPRCELVDISPMEGLINNKCVTRPTSSP